MRLAASTLVVGMAVTMAGCTSTPADPLVTPTSAASPSDSPSDLASSPEDQATSALPREPRSAAEVLASFPTSIDELTLAEAQIVMDRFDDVDLQLAEALQDGDGEAFQVAMQANTTPRFGTRYRGFWVSDGEGHGEFEDMFRPDVGPVTSTVLEVLTLGDDGTCLSLLVSRDYTLMLEDFGVSPWFIALAPSSMADGDFPESNASDYVLSAASISYEKTSDPCALDDSAAEPS